MNVRNLPQVGLTRRLHDGKTESTTWWGRTAGDQKEFWCRGAMFGGFVRVLVTGGAGFIGSNLVDALVERGDDVAVVDDLSTGHLENVNPNAMFYAGSVNDYDLVYEAARGRDLVFHLAAARAVLLSVERPQHTDHVNVAGTLNVLVAARDAGVCRMVSASSSSVYGGSAVMPTPETVALLPKSPYAVSKLTGEHYCRVFSELYGLETVSLRYFNVFGPRQRPDSQYAAVIPLFIAALDAGLPAEVHGDGRQTRDFTYITDVVRANLCAASAPADQCSGKAYNVAGGRSWSLLDLLETISEILGVAAETQFTAPRAGDVRHTLADLSAAHADLGWLPETTFADGLKATVAWFAEAGAARAAVSA